LISGFVEFFVVLIHRFVVLGVDLHIHKFSSPNSSYFARNHRFFTSISAKLDEQLAQNFSKKSEPEKAGLRPAKAGLLAGHRNDSPTSSRIDPHTDPCPARPPRLALASSAPHPLACLAHR
jgi:hypothetical protein